MNVNKQEVEDLISRCYDELSLASREKYDADKAERTAAMFLAALMQLAYVVEEVEGFSRHSKTEIERISAERYFDCKNDAQGKKMTEVALANMVAKDIAVQEAKAKNIAAEAELKKYNYVMSTLREGHLFYRNISKQNNQF